MRDDATKLLPCPFCGGPARLRNGGPDNWFVRCEACMVASNDVGYEHAIDLWNRRAPVNQDDGGGK